MNTTVLPLRKKKMSSLRLRSALLLIVATVWIGWACWANYPHRYDAQLMQQELDVAFAPNVAPTLGPARVGFPVEYMRYDFSFKNQLTVHNTDLGGILLNLLLCPLGILAAVLLVAHVPHVTFTNLASVFVLLVLGVALYFLLNGPHPIVTTYFFFVPLILLLAAVCRELFSKYNAAEPADERKFAM